VKVDFRDFNGKGLSAVWQTYPGRYSRTPSSSQRIKCRLSPGKRANSICKIDLLTRPG
jgi:hypothetical protein